MQPVSHSTRVGRQVGPAKLVPKGQRRAGSHVPNRQGSMAPSRGRGRSSSVVSTRTTRSRSSSVLQPLDERLDERIEDSHDRQETPIEPVRVKAEPIDVDRVDPDITPALPDRTPGEVEAMRTGAAESLSARTILGSGLDDPSSMDMGRTSPSPEPDAAYPNPGLLTPHDMFDGNADQDEEPDEKEFKPVTRLSYTGFSIASRHLVLIIEPWPPLTEEQLPATSRRASRSTTARMTRASRSVRPTGEVDASFSSMGSVTPSIPHSRRGGTASVDDRGSLLRNRSETPLVANVRANSRNAAATPLFRDPTPLNQADGDGGEGEDDQLFYLPDEMGSEEEEEREQDEQWRRRVRETSWAPLRGGGSNSGAQTRDDVDSGGFGFRTDLEREPSMAPSVLNDQDDNDQDPEQDGQDMSSGMLAMSHRIQDGLLTRRQGIFGDESDQLGDGGPEWFETSAGQ